MLKLYQEIFDPERKKLFTKLKDFSKNGFLAGGTALALQIGHRKSFDFDIFLPKPLSLRFYRKTLEILGKETKIKARTGDIMLTQTPEGIEVHFVYYWYKNLQPLIKTASLSLASVEDIAANKAFTIGQRGAWRDYVDVFFLIKKGIFTLAKIIELSNKKYRTEFNSILFLEQLTYFGDIKNFDISFLKESFSVSEIQSFLEKEVKEYLKNSKII